MKTLRQKKAFQKKMLTRSKTAIWLIIFYILFITLCILSSDVWLKGILTKTQNFIFALCCLVLLTPIVVFACKEITKLSFVHKKIALLITTLIITFFMWGLGLFYTINRYFILPAMEQAPDFVQANFDKYLQRIFFINIVLNISYAFGLFVGSFIVVYFCRKRSEILMFRKSIFWFPVLMLLVGLFFPTIFCISISYQWTTFVFLIAMSNLFDVFAYLGGSIWGRVKLLEKVSPKKTVEGLIFSFVISLALFLGIFAIFIYVDMPLIKSKNIVYSILGNQFSQPNDVGSWWWWLIAIIFISILLIVSTVGDLFFSYIKRQYRIKDFSRLLPGHGGVLDRLDAISFVFSFYYFFTIIAITIPLDDKLSHIQWFWLGR